MADGVESTSICGNAKETDIDAKLTDSIIVSDKKKKKNKRKKSCSEEEESSFKEIIRQQRITINELQEKVFKLTQIIKQVEDSNDEMDYDEEYPPLPVENDEMNDKEYQPLSNTVEGVQMQVQSQGKQKGSQQNNIITHNAQNNTKAVAKEVTGISAKKKPPPITIYNTDPMEIISKIKSKIKGCNFNVDIINKNVVEVLAQQVAEHTTIVSLLKSEGLKFFTYTPKESKPLTFIIKKLPLSYEVVDVQDAIGNLKINIKKVIKTNYNWLFQVSNESDIKVITNIKYLLHCKVVIEPLKQKRLTQCKNCQRFNHSAVNCNMPYRCVKCAGTHEPGNCPIPKKENNNQVVVITDEVTGIQTNRIGLPVK